MIEAWYYAFFGNLIGGFMIYISLCIVFIVLVASAMILAGIVTRWL